MICDIYNEKFNKKYRIKSARHPNFNYSSNGIYFITICTLNRNNFFGEITEKEIILSNRGKIAKNHWEEIPKHYPKIFLNDFIIMPNHIHGLIEIKNMKTPNVETTYQGVSNNDNNSNYFSNNYKNLIASQKWKSSLIAKVINQFKRTTSIEMKSKNLFFGWQTRFFDWNIKNNPINWKKDDLYFCK